MFLSSVYRKAWTEHFRSHCRQCYGHKFDLVIVCMLLCIVPPLLMSSLLGCGGGGAYSVSPSFCVHVCVCPCLPMSPSLRVPMRSLYDCPSLCVLLTLTNPNPKADRKRGGKTTSRNAQAGSSQSPRGQWRTEKNGRNWLWSHVLPQRPPWLRDRWRWRNPNPVSLALTLTHRNGATYLETTPLQEWLYKTLSITLYAKSGLVMVCVGTVRAYPITVLFVLSHSRLATLNTVDRTECKIGFSHGLCWNCACLPHYCPLCAVSQLTGYTEHCRCRCMQNRV